jgi:hypothetical protein
MATTGTDGVATLRAYSGGYTVVVSGHGINKYSSKINVLPEQPNQQFTVETKASSNTALIISIIVILLVVIVGGAFIYMKKKGKLNKPGANGLVGGPKDGDDKGLVAKDPSVIQPNPIETSKPEVSAPPLAMHSDQNPSNPKPVESKPVEIKTAEPKPEVAKVDVNTIHPKFEPNIHPTGSTTIIRPTNGASGTSVSASKIHVN